jgi:hypothetical protein
MPKRKSLEARMIHAAEQALTAGQYVTPIDIFVGMGLLQEAQVADWRTGKIPYLERAIQSSLGKIGTILRAFQRWAKNRDLNPRETAYYARTRGFKRRLQFSKTGQDRLEQIYRTHYISSALSEAKQQKILMQKSSVPERMVYILVRDTVCAQCHKIFNKGAFLLMEAEQPRCLSCAGLQDWVFLPRGDASLSRGSPTRHVHAAQVVKYHPVRNRYERQGILVDERALAAQSSESQP